MIVRVIGLALPILVCLMALARAGHRGGGLRELPLAIGLGIGGSSLVWWMLMQLPLPSSAWLASLDAAVWLGLGVAAFGIKGFQRQASGAGLERDRGEPRAVWAAAVLLAAVGVLAIASFVGASLVEPHGEWDAWAVWNQHARFFVRGYPDEWRGMFSVASFHRSYPLLLPLSVARGWVIVGRETVLVPIGLAALFAMATVLVAAGSVRQSRTTVRGLTVAAILLASPIFVREAAGQIADVPLGYYMLATFVLIARAIESRLSMWWLLAGASAGFAAWTKDEGAVFVLAVVALCGGWAVRSGGWRGVKAMAPLMAGALPSVIALIAFKVWLAPPNELVTAQTFSHITSSVTDAARLHLVAGAFARELWAGGATAVGVLPILALYVVVAGVRRPVPAAPALAIATVTLLVATDALVYVLTPFPLTWHLSTSLGRVLLQVFPLLAWAGIMLTGPGGAGRPNRDVGAVSV